MKHFFAPLIVAGAAAVGCGKASIQKNDMTTVEGRIARSDASSIYLAMGDEEVAIARAEIDSIDHPGEIAALSGAGMLLVGVALIGGSQAIKTGNCKRDFVRCGIGYNLTWYPGIVLASIGIPASLYGLITWSLSKKAAADPDGEAPEPNREKPDDDLFSMHLTGLAPLLDSSRRVTGLTMEFRFYAARARLVRRHRVSSSRTCRGAP